MRFLTYLVLFICLWSCDQEIVPLEYINDEHLSKSKPSDHLYFQRAYPDTFFNVRSLLVEVAHIRKEDKKTEKVRRSANTWVTQGPGNAGARINTIAVDHTNQDIIYLGYSGGGIYKTTDGGNHWTPIFDDHPFLSIGVIKIHPSRPQEIFVGTGDPNISGTPFIGNGLMKSVDGGMTWESKGLEQVGIISKVIIDPSNEGTLFVSAMGTPFFRDEHRGIYKSTDGGSNWKKVLYLGHQTGVIDMIQDPSDSDVLYAAGWDRLRNYEESITTGEGAKIYRSLNGGEDWSLLSNGLPQSSQSRIGLAISPSNPKHLYAIYVGTDHEVYGIYSSTDGGEHWKSIPTDRNSDLSPVALGGFGWYFAKLAVHPANEDDLYLLGVRLWRYNSNKRQWKVADQKELGVVHPDMHALVFLNDHTLLLGTDGGLYKSTDGGEYWVDIDNIPTTQFYRIALNPHRPGMFYGGAQDNGSLFGNEARHNNWHQYFGGDGFRTLFHPIDSNIWYVETQEGGLTVTTNGGQSMKNATKGIDRSDRINWDAPVILSQHNPNVLYFGTHRIYQSTSGTSVDFKPISPILTDDIVLLDLTSNVTAIAESPFDSLMIYVGTGDGNLWRTDNLGHDWSPITSQLPDRYVTSIHPSQEYINKIYVSQSGYKSGEYLPHIHRSDDNGETWTDISGDLPGLPVNDLLILPNNDDNVIFAGSDAGVYFTVDGGNSWNRLGNNMPYIPVFDMEYDPLKNLLVAGTFGKSILTYDLHQEGISGDQVSSINEKLQMRINVYPNPTDDLLNITVPGVLQSPLRYSIFDSQGRVVRGDEVLIGSSLDIGSLNIGTYYIRIIGLEKSYLGQFIKN